MRRWVIAVTWRKHTFAGAWTANKSVLKWRLELDRVGLIRYLLHRPSLAARSHHQMLRGRKDLQIFQLHVVRLPADPLHDGTGDVGNTNSRIVPDGQWNTYKFNRISGLSQSFYRASVHEAMQSAMLVYQFCPSVRHYGIVSKRVSCVSCVIQIVGTKWPNDVIQNSDGVTQMGSKTRMPAIAKNRVVNLELRFVEKWN